ncbi:MAG: hypothetical protein OEZ23_04850, partial [Gammaproteobacteria bacterium]|nr:hypothetical protein [Gammaproteobacteria bacterium]
VLPALLGFVWLINHSAVFVIGAVIALGSLLLSQLIPDHPQQGGETRVWSMGSFLIFTGRKPSKQR